MSLSEDGTRSELGVVREIVFELMLAAATLTSWPALDQRSTGEAVQRACAMVFLPIVGLVFGVILALVDRALGATLGPLSRSAMVVAIAILATKGLYPAGVAHMVGELRGGRRPSWTGLTEVGPAGALAALAFVALEIYLLGAIAHPPARARAIVLAVMLSRWAIVPTAIGLKPLGRFGLGVPYEGGIKFRDFALASVIALGLAMGLYEVIAIAAIAAVAITILVLRLLFSRRLGG
ncbi:MAG: adenosylcobinamide-GDP ribazoletransferase, partial [Candidatus Binataceae bacterium]